MAQTENSVTAYDVEDWKNKGRIQMSPAERESWLNEGQLLLTDYAEGIEREWDTIPSDNRELQRSLRRWRTGASSF